jgi:hypothetical protein
MLLEGLDYRHHRTCPAGRGGADIPLPARAYRRSVAGDASGAILSMRVAPVDRMDDELQEIIAVLTEVEPIGQG